MQDSKIRGKQVKEGQKKRDRVDSPEVGPKDDVSAIEINATGEPDSMPWRNKYSR